MYENGSDVIELRIPKKKDYVSVARLLISGLTNKLGFSYEEMENVKFEVAEEYLKLTQNRRKSKEHIILTCTVYMDKLEIVLK